MTAEQFAKNAAVCQSSVLQSVLLLCPWQVPSAYTKTYLYRVPNRLHRNTRWGEKSVEFLGEEKKGKELKRDPMRTIAELEDYFGLDTHTKVHHSVTTGSKNRLRILPWDLPNTFWENK